MIIGVKFLNGYHGADSNRESDWPPSPARLFSALTNAMYTIQRIVKSDNYRALLIWLENQIPPNIYYVPSIQQNFSPPVCYVPLPDGQTDGKTMVRQAKTFPVAHLQNEYLYYEWENLEIPAGFENIIRYVEQIGNSRTIVIAKTLKELPELSKEFIKIVPDDSGKKMLSCYYPGRLDLSDQTKTLGGKPINISIPYSRQEVEREKPFEFADETFLFELSGKYKLFSTQVSLLADAIRSRFLKIAYDLEIKPSCLIGDNYDRHIAFLPLPFVGKYGTGEIFGVNIVVPKISDKERNEFEKVIESFIDEGGKFKFRDDDWVLTLVKEDKNTKKTLLKKTWNCASKLWRTVTPSEINWKVPPDEYVKGLCEKLGLPVLKVTSFKQPFFNGIDNSQKYISRNSIKKNKSGFLTHFEIEFSKPVRGPLFVGNSSNFGLGLMKPCFRELQ